MISVHSFVPLDCSFTLSAFLLQQSVDLAP